MNVIIGNCTCNTAHVLNVLHDPLTDVGIQPPVQ